MEISADEKKISEFAKLILILKKTQSASNIVH